MGLLPGHDGIGCVCVWGGGSGGLLPRHDGIGVVCGVCVWWGSFLDMMALARGGVLH